MRAPWHREPAYLAQIMAINRAAVGSLAIFEGGIQRTDHDGLFHSLSIERPVDATLKWSSNPKRKLSADRL